MLTGLEALGLACNIMQVISFTGELIKTFKAIHRGQSPDVAAAATATQMSGVFERLSQSLAKAPQPLNKDEMEVAVIGAQCLDAATELKLELDKIWDGSTKGSFRAAMAGAARKMLNQHNIEDLEKLLRAHQDAIQQLLLQRIW